MAKLNKKIKRTKRTNKTKRTRISNKKSKLTKKIYYTLKDVQKHATLRNAWTIIHNKVYRIPYSWITDGHPGGRIIERAIGKDATKLFDSIGHSDFAKKKLATFLIGYLKK